MELVNSQTTLWDALKDLRVTLSDDAEVTTQYFRNEPWFVVKDCLSGEVFRLAGSLRIVVEPANAEQTIGEALAEAEPATNDHSKIQIALALVQLYRAHLVSFEPAQSVPQPIRALRAERTAGKKRLNPIALRIPLWDPDRFLSTLKPIAERLITVPALIVAFAIALGGLIVGLSHADSLAADISSQLQTPTHWWLFVIAYLSLKLAHELAHGLAVKRWGGAVHDVGVMLLVFFPVPYVDASASTAFPDKYQRMTVAAVGILAEALIASIGLVVWLNVEPGLLRTFAFDLVLIGGVSTLLFNGNPLMRFDAYYVLADYLEIPNLFARSRKYLNFALIRFGLRDTSLASPAASPSEARWLLGYGITSSLYRIVVLFGIAIYLANTFFMIGVVFALWTVLTQIGAPVVKFLLQLREADKASQRRLSLVARFAMIITVVGLFVGLVPLPHSTLATGIVTVEDDRHVRAEVGGFVSESMVRPGVSVAAGTAVATLENEALLRDRAVAEAIIAAVHAELDGARLNGVEMGIIRETLAAREAQLAEIETRVSSLSLVSAADGEFVAATAKPILGRFMERGETIGYVVDPRRLIVRVVVDEKFLDLVKRDTRHLSLRFLSNPEESYRGATIKTVPSALTRLPSAALGTDHGGDIAVEPGVEDGLVPLSKVFQVDIKPEQLPQQALVSSRAYARFVHTPEPLLPRALRTARRLFLSKFAT